MVEKNTRLAILEVAAADFSAQGYAAVSMRDIAAAVGITPAALYHHFADKETLYTATVAHVFQEKLSPLEAVWADPSSPEERLGKAVERLARLVADDKPFARLLHRELLDGDEVRLEYLIQSVMKEPFNRLVVLFTEISPELDAVRAALFTIGIILGHNTLSRVFPVMPEIDPDAREPGLFARYALDVLLRGITSHA